MDNTNEVPSQMTSRFLQEYDKNRQQQRSVKEIEELRKNINYDSVEIEPQFNTNITDYNIEYIFHLLDIKIDSYESYEELKKVSGNYIDIIGVNNRNLDTLKIDLNHSIEIYKEIPDEFLKISESGISKVESIHKLKEVGYQGFLIGENFMKSNNPMEAAHIFIKQVENEI